MLIADSNAILRVDAESPIFTSWVDSGSGRAANADVDLIDQRQMLVPFGVLDFIDADGVDLAERPVLETPGDNMLDRAKCLHR
jgi:hypothetical protein